MATLTCPSQWLIFCAFLPIASETVCRTLAPEESLLTGTAFSLEKLFS